MREYEPSNTTNLLLICIIMLGAYLRFANLSPFKVYPDSYQSLVVAHNISTYNSVLGTLGDHGMLYPEYVMWTRPGFPLLIDAISLVTKNPVETAQTITLLAGILAIPLAFLLIKTIYTNQRSTIAGLAGAFLLAISFNHTVWGGFIMTESIGVFWMLLLLVSLFRGIEKETQLANPKDFLTGIIFAIAVLTRYEYAIMLFPLIVLIFSRSPSPYKKSTNILVAFLFGIGIAASSLFPVKETFLVLTSQNHALLIRAAIVLVFFSFLAVVWRVTPATDKQKFVAIFSYGLIGGIWILSLLTIAQLILPFGFLNHPISFLRSFVTHDFVLSFLSLVGITVLLSQKQLRSLGLFSIFSLITLALFYQRVNPEMERYATHLIPFLLIPSSYAITVMLRKRWTIFPILLFFLAQGLLTNDGMKHWTDGSWYRTSYEEKAAIAIHPYINKNVILIASFPESYYFFSGNTTYSIADTPPYIYIDRSLDNRPALIIIDMGMYDLFPNFTRFVEKEFAKEKSTTTWIHETYHYSNRSQKETHPVTVYETTIGQLKKRIAESSK